jgi:signal transduction histidine kinase
MKKILTVFFLISVSFLIVKHETWMNYIYSSLGNKQFSIKGISKNFEVACRDLPISTPFCAKGYRYPLSSWNTAKDEMISVGAGTFFGGTIWYCETGKGIEKIFETGNPDWSTKFRSNHNFYQSAVINSKLCARDIFVEAVRDPYFPPNFAGWRLGPLLIGKPSVVSAYKNIYDFFSSYMRAILGILALVFLFSTPKDGKRSFAHEAYFYGIFCLSLMMFLTSGLVDILIPSLSAYVVTLVSVARCVGYTYVLISILSRTNKLLLDLTRRLLSLYGALLLSMGSVVFFTVFSGRFDLSVIFFFGVSIFVGALVIRSLTLVIFGLLLTCDGLAIANVLLNYPTYSSVPFLFIAFLYDSVRSIFLRSKVEELFQKSDRNPDLFYEALNFISKHLNVKRVSISVTGEKKSVKSFLVSESGLVLMSEQTFDSRVFAQVAISKLPLLRVDLRSPEMEKICGTDANMNYQYGVEFCVFPMFYQGRFYGTLNITGYTLLSLGDISDLELFLELVSQSAFRIQDAVYRTKVSPNTVESRIALEVENELYSDFNVTADKVKESLDKIAKSLSGRLIISVANKETGIFHLFSVHQASPESAANLILNTPKIDSFNAHSPMNIAFHEKRDIFIDNLHQFDALYPRYITDHLKKHGTEIVYVTPVLGINGEVWGTVWAEYGRAEKQRVNGGAQEISRILAHSVRRQLEYFLKRLDVQEARLREERAIKMGEVAMQMAHDIRSPLAAMEVGLSQSSQPSPQSRELLLTAKNRIYSIAQDLLHWSDATQVSSDTTNLKSMTLEEIISNLLREKRLEYQNFPEIIFRMELSGDLSQNPNQESSEHLPYTFKQDSTQLERILSNLINNSVESLAEKGEVTVKLYRMHRSIFIQVDDDGSGIPEEILKKLGSPNVTFGKQSGFGLGVYHAKKTLKEWGGDLFYKKREQGTSAIIQLPEE